MNTDENLERKECWKRLIAFLEEKEIKLINKIDKPKDIKETLTNIFSF